MPDVSLEQRLQRLEDIEAIRQLKADYAEACDDDHNPERIAALFLPDAVWHRLGEDPCEGHDQIKAYMRAIRESGRLRNSSHLFMNPHITIDGDSATGHWKLVMVYTGNVPGGGTQYHRIIGSYDEQYERHAGRWMFRRLEVTVLEADAYSVEPSKFDQL